MTNFNNSRSVGAVVGGITPNWRHVGAFLGLTFGLTWLLDLAVYLRGGLSAPGMITILQFQMLLPAFSAIVLGIFFFPESPLYRTRPAGRGRWFYYYFLMLTLVFALGVLAGVLAPGQPTVAALASIIPLLLSFLGLILLIVLRRSEGREAMARVWLTWGRPRYWLLFGLAIGGWYVLQAALNAVTGLGGAVLTPLPAVPGLSPTLMLVIATAQTVLLGPVLGIVITFGEEYGWRGYLQAELFKLGRVRGVLLLGVIWGAWHWPVILMGYNYPQHPVLGVLLMTLYTTGLAVVLGYAVLMSGSVLLAAYLHAQQPGRRVDHGAGFCAARHGLLIPAWHLRPRHARRSRIPDPARPDLAWPGQHAGWRPGIRSVTCSGPKGIVIAFRSRCVTNAATRYRGDIVPRYMTGPDAEGRPRALTLGTYGGGHGSSPKGTLR